MTTADEQDDTQFYRVVEAMVARLDEGEQFYSMQVGGLWLIFYSGRALIN